MHFAVNGIPPRLQKLPDSRTVTGMSETPSPVGLPNDVQERLRRYAEITAAVARRLHATPSLLTRPDAGGTVSPGSEVEPRSTLQLNITR